uniref:Uncharacterized protein n=1 Tax=Panagrolaimus superbus TaxID=310955 RepID=A0A914Z2C0_9BILA
MVADQCRVGEAIGKERLCPQGARPATDTAGGPALPELKATIDKQIPSRNALGDGIPHGLRDLRHLGQRVVDLGEILVDLGERRALCFTPLSVRLNGIEVDDLSCHYWLLERGESVAADRSSSTFIPSTGGSHSFPTGPADVGMHSEFGIGGVVACQENRAAYQEACTAHVRHERLARCHDYIGQGSRAPCSASGVVVPPEARRSDVATFPPCVELQLWRAAHRAFELCDNAAGATVEGHCVPVHGGAAPAVGHFCNREGLLVVALAQRKLVGR